MRVAALVPPRALVLHKVVANGRVLAPPAVGLLLHGECAWPDHVAAEGIAPRHSRDVAPQWSGMRQPPGQMRPPPHQRHARDVTHLWWLKVAEVVGEAAHEAAVAETLEKVETYALLFTVDGNDVLHAVRVLARCSTGADALGKIEADLAPVISLPSCGVSLCAGGWVGGRPSTRRPDTCGRVRKDATPPTVSYLTSTGTRTKTPYWLPPLRQNLGPVATGKTGCEAGLGGPSLAQSPRHLGEQPSVTTDARAGLRHTTHRQAVSNDCTFLLQRSFLHSGARFGRIHVGDSRCWLSALLLEVGHGTPLQLTHSSDYVGWTRQTYRTQRGLSLWRGWTRLPGRRHVNSCPRRFQGKSGSRGSAVPTPPSGRSCPRASHWPRSLQELGVYRFIYRSLTKRTKYHNEELFCCSRMKSFSRCRSGRGN